MCYQRGGKGYRRNKIHRTTSDILDIISAWDETLRVLTGRNESEEKNKTVLGCIPKHLCGNGSCFKDQ